jgi:hypothetical protein
MKMSSFHPSLADFTPWTLRVSALGTAVVVLTAGAFSLRAQYQSDDFNDGNDTGWTHYDPFAGLGLPIMNWSFPNGGYRLRTTAPSPDPANAGPGRGGSLRSDIYTNFFISVDIVNWNDTLPQSAGILARIRNAGLGTTLGYAFTWDRGNPTNATGGDLDISVITGEAPDGVSVTGSDSIHLTPGNSYRFVFIGRGPALEGRVYQLPDTNTPLNVISGTDATYDYGASGLVIYDNSDTGTSLCDVTFDNFVANDVEPPRLEMVFLEFGELAVAWPLEAISYTLQVSETLPGNPWTSIPPDLLRIVGNQLYYDQPSNWASGPNRFFRLIRP